jgi:pseudouridine-5'-phosphate glycosidase
MARFNLHLHPEVESALSSQRPLVALESTLITHGFPYPDNLKIAQAIEQTVRDHGAVPATIAILGGQVMVGLTEEQLGTLAAADKARKCSIRDLPLVIAHEGNGGTTVAATMMIAHRVGIDVFVTGGIGGVHRGDTWDISADLTELSRTPITVVCAGMKAFLDLPATLEYLETLAVPVLGYGVSELPAFYSRRSGLPVDAQVDTPEAVAEIIRVRNDLQLSNAILIAIPVPAADEWPAEQAQAAIEQALAEAKAHHITGKAITPFLLDYISQLSGQKSKQANKSLLLNNAHVGAQIAVARCNLLQASTLRKNNSLIP